MPVQGKQFLGLLPRRMVDAREPGQGPTSQDPARRVLLDRVVLGVPTLPLPGRAQPHKAAAS